MKGVRNRLLRSSSAADIDAQLAKVRGELERLKRVHPDLRNRRGLHHADLVLSIAELKKAELNGAERPSSIPFHIQMRIDKSQLAIATIKRHRNGQHLKAVAAHPCLVCGRKPAQAHHIRYAQDRGMGLKVSDEFTVPLCAIHHDALHRSGNERQWWLDVNIDPVPIAYQLWDRSRGLDIDRATAGSL